MKPSALEGQGDRSTRGISNNSSDTDRSPDIDRKSVSLDVAARNDALLRSPRGGIHGELDRWVVERMLRWCSKQRADGKLLSARFHLNLSGDSVCDESFLAFLRLMLTKHALPADTLCFEIGEADLVGHRLEVMSCAQALRMLGCRVALDRFRGVSESFSALLDLPIDCVKIDGSIVGALLSDRQSQMKARIVSKLAQSGRVRTVAEHVENAETLEMLRRIGIDYVQGFGIAMPEPLEHFKIRAGENEECLHTASG